MNESTLDSVSSRVPGVERIVMRKTFLRNLPPMALLYFIPFLDRPNVACAKLTMMPELGVSEWVYEFCGGLFFVGYLILEIPGALVVQRWGARRWITQIMVLWGTCESCRGFIHSAGSVYTGRFLLVVVEGGLFPGVIVYLSHWIPEMYGAGAIAIFTLASPAALAAGRPIAGWLLTLRWMGLSGWRWLSILEALPAIWFGFLTWFVLPDGPQNVFWLSASERSWLLAHLQKESRSQQPSSSPRISTIVRSPLVLLMFVIIFLAKIGIQGFFLWVPTMLQRAADLTPSRASLISGVPFTVGVVSTLLSSWCSDRSQRRDLHIYLPLLFSGIVVSLTSLDGLVFGWISFLLCISSAAIYAFEPSRYLIPSLMLRGRHAAAMVGLINILAGLGALTGSAVVGRMLTLGFSFSTMVRLLSGRFLFSGVTCFGIRRRLQYRAIDQSTGFNLPVSGQEET